ncbi:porin [Telluria mixta]|uniref:Porin n=1 Tax=Telluria mixta TaxID=34071 RepID=A0ABT2BSE7_9BURK|nr:porin [Telluria mixta]MCS0628044.1 porin [Telluria mixta]WEM93839.1 porin [Telluria mixta]
MHSRFIPLAGLLLATAAHAQDSAVQVYGRLNVALEHADSSSGPGLVRLVNNRSVLGFRGGEDLGGGLKAIFQIEGTLSPDTGAGALAARDTRVGLAGTWGTLFAGHWTTAYNGATSGLDPFYPTTAGFMSIMGNGSAADADNVSDTSSFDRRQSNSIHYWSPAWLGLSLRVTHGLNEEKPANGAKPSLTSAAAIYERGPWYAVLAGERHHEYQGPGLDDTGAKAALAYQFPQTRIAVVAERLKYGTGAGELARNAVYLSLSHQMGPHGIRIGIARAGDASGPAGTRIGFVRAGAGTGATHATLGYDYTLSKRSSLYAYTTRLDNRANGVYEFAINSLGAAPGATLKAYVLGMRHNF